MYSDEVGADGADISDVLYVCLLNYFKFVCCWFLLAVDGKCDKTGTSNKLARDY
jgi:hypothetical protein